MKTSIITGRDIFKHLRTEQVDAIAKAAEEVTYDAGEVVYHRGEPATFFFMVLEGQVSLRLPQDEGVSLQIDDLTNGAIFGSCVCMQLDKYTLTARCVKPTRLLKIRSAALKGIMDGDPILGYTLQAEISRAYFLRYIETMRKLQAIVQSVPIEAA